MQKITTSIKLPFVVDTNTLENDETAILGEKWMPNFNRDGNKGDWKVIPLYAAGGNAESIYA